VEHFRSSSELLDLAAELVSHVPGSDDFVRRLAVDLKRVRTVIAHYENQTEQEQAAEIEQALKTSRIANLYVTGKN
jgi:hypothetical protein